VLRRGGWDYPECSSAPGRPGGCAPWLRLVPGLERVPEEFTIADFAELVLRIMGSSPPIVYRPLPEDDPAWRCPDIGKARMALGWQPEVRVKEGGCQSMEWLQSRYYSYGFAG
jgi:nucleoside-diphosphate-sugar epimerase